MAFDDFLSDSFWAAQMGKKIVLSRIHFPTMYMYGLDGALVPHRLGQILDIASVYGPTKVDYFRAGTEQRKQLEGQPVHCNVPASVFIQLIQAGCWLLCLRHGLHN